MHVLNVAISATATDLVLPIAVVEKDIMDRSTNYADHAIVEMH